MRWFDADFDYVNEFVDQWNGELRRARRTGVVAGVVMVALGVLCALSPWGALSVVQVLIAAAVAVMGVAQIASYAHAPALFRDPSLIVLGILNIVLGLLVATMPVEGTGVALTLVLAIVLLVSGVQRLSFASQMRFFRLPTSSVTTLGGVLDIILAIVFFVWPLAAAVMLNYFIAAYLVVGGALAIVEAASMRTIRR